MMMKHPELNKVILGGKMRDECLCYHRIMIKYNLQSYVFIMKVN